MLLTTLVRAPFPSELGNLLDPDRSKIAIDKPASIHSTLYSIMGGRLSTPRGPAGLTEASRPHAQPRRAPLNPRTLVAPLAAITMAGLLFVYARTSIRAAKLNAQRHREADGGQISWHNQNLRRHGQLKRPEQGTIKDVLWSGEGEAKKTKEEKKSVTSVKSKDEQRLRLRMGKKDEEEAKEK